MGAATSGVEVDPEPRGEVEPSARSGPDVRDVVAGDAGQTTAEYALVLLGAAAVALLLLAWASQTGAIGDLLDFIVEQIVGRVA
jgi:hypothetical protein